MAEPNLTLSFQLPETMPPRTSSPTAEAQLATTLPDIPGYELLGILGRGGMGIVYRARHIELNRVLAIKMIVAGDAASPESLARFRTEAVAVARLQHPNIVQIHDIGQYLGRLYLSLEYVAGGDLATRLASTPQPPRDAALLVEALARAIDYAHQQGVVHRDLKPGNILLHLAGRQDQSVSGIRSGADKLTARGRSTWGESTSGVAAGEPVTDYGVPKITDFGLAKQLDTNSGATQSGEILGTPSYMAPEQAAGLIEAVGPSADVYALGAILYELLTGRPPFRGASVLDTLEQVRTQEPVAPRQLQPKTPLDLETICLTALRKEPKRRYASAAVLADDLRRFLVGEPIQARAVGNLERGYRWCRRNPALAGLIAATLLVLVSLGAGAWYREQLRQTSLVADANAKAAEASAKAAAASSDAARAQEYYSLVNQVRQRSVTATRGWTWAAIADLQAAARLETKARDMVELRGLASVSLSRFDFREAGVLLPDFDPAALAFSPDSKLLAIGQNKHNLRVNVAVVDLATKNPTQMLKVDTALTNVTRLFSGSNSPQDGIRGLAFSPNGEWLVAGTKSGKLARWNLAAAEPKSVVWQAHGPDDEISSVDFIADSSMLISASYGKAVKRWSISKNWAESLVTDELADLSDLAASADGRLVATAASRRLKLVRLDAQGRAAITEHDIGAHRLDLSPDGRTLICKYGDQLSVVDPRTGIEGRVFQLPADEPPPAGTAANYVAFSPDSSLVATSWADQRVRVWDVASGKIVGTVAVPGRGNLIVKFSPNGRWLAVSGDRETRLFEVQPVEIVSTQAHDSNPVKAIELTPDGSTLIAATESGTASHVTGSSLSWSDVATGQQIKDEQVAGWADKNVRFLPMRPSLAAHPQGNMIAQVASLVGTKLAPGPAAMAAPVAKVLSPSVAASPFGPSAVELQESAFRLPDPPAGIEIVDDPEASDGRAIRIAGGSPGREVRLPIPNECRQKAAMGWTVLGRLRIEHQAVVGPAYASALVVPDKSWRRDFNLSLNPSGNYHWHLLELVREESEAAHAWIDVAIITPDGQPPGTTIWIDAVLFVPLIGNHWTGELKPLPQGPICFAPDGSRLWGIVDADRVVSWHVPQLKVASQWHDALSGNLYGQTNFDSLASGSEWVVAGRSSGFAYVFSAQTGEQAQKIEGPGGAIRAIAIDPYGRTAILGTSEGYVRVIGLPDGQTIANLTPHTQSVESIAFSKGGKLLVTAGHDGLIRLWWQSDASYEPLVTLQSLSSRIHSVRLDAAGQNLAVLAEPERAVRIWRLDRLHDRLNALGIGW